MSTSVNTDNAALYDAINSANKSAATGSKTASLDSTDSAQDRFLKLLTAQLKNQDPLNPLDNAQMTSQLAQISTVDGITKLNATMQAMLGNSTDSQALQAAALIGHAVLVPGSNLMLANGQSIGGIEMAGAADKVVATIKDANGLVVRTLDLGEFDAGLSNYTWDGTTDNGTPAADGIYTVSFSARQGENSVNVTALEYAAVTSVARNSQGVTLTVGSQDMVVSLSDVKQII
ncbi:flagellar hook assembly protein [Sterolibacterium denitrificans]|uniref:Basal-body rod modification protein FlgD n=2 Tax=Sterolibacterium denitrificans TaxID=157592 RepID=A0A656Z8J9_9PROT|nr:flagellar hook assembly protein FlgD [Sterolibacterium denitrificans]KYC29317.1 flagellar basal body rod modification protein FlgD [Sterolibacterium denitrificans]SMB30720.1 flagellar hook assembly protein [Sterolibacterium denitrificans]